MKRVVYNSPAIKYLEVFPEGCLAASFGTDGNTYGLQGIDEKNYDGFDW